jgi:hypothetical protein
MTWVPIFGYPFYTPGPTPLYNPPHSTNGLVPGSTVNIPKGTTYLFAKNEQHATVHVIKSGYDCNTAECLPQMGPMFDCLYVPLMLTGNQFIQQIGGGAGWGFLELYEIGDGLWKRGQAINFGDNEHAKKTLHDYGFLRGAREPIWVVLRKM